MKVNSQICLRDNEKTSLPLQIALKLREHAPFTFAGTLIGILIMAGFVIGKVPQHVSSTLFWTFHPLHVLLSAQVTTAMYRSEGGGRFFPTLLIGYVGSIGIATLSDSLLPYLGEWLLNLPHRGIHLGFIEKAWLVNPLTLMGIWLGYQWPRTRFSHAGHVLLSTWASLFHITMAFAVQPDVFVVIIITAVLFISVWVPCCTSDILFPLLFVKRNAPAPLKCPPPPHEPGS